MGEKDLQFFIKFFIFYFVISAAGEIEVPGIYQLRNLIIHSMFILFSICWKFRSLVNFVFLFISDINI